jgi:hypothetical protein
MSEKIIRIGGASGSYVDSAIAVPQLLTVPQMNYLIFDYLAEGSMGRFGRMQAVNPASGYLPDFVDVHVGPYLREMKQKGVKVVANAGGLNPHGLADALRTRADEMGVQISVGVVDGDDLRPRLDELRQRGITEMFTGAAFPDKVLTANAYFGGFPIADALARGADIVVTGRVVDSALILGPLIHEFGWSHSDFDLLAAGTVAGHLLECGAQVSGGTFTDWADVPDWAHVGFPVGECRADGSLVITKPDGTGGLVSIGTVAEQLMYEVTDPQAYIVPDVVVDFTTVKLKQEAPNRVRVSGATGYAPTPAYKVSVTYDDGWSSTAVTPIIGVDAAKRAERQAAAILERTREMLQDRNLADWRLTHLEILGNEAGYGHRARQHGSREVLMKLVVHHDDRRATDLFWREQTSAIMNMSVGTSVGLGSTSLPITQHYSFLIDKTEAVARVTVDGEAHVAKVPTEGGYRASRTIRPSIPAAPVDAATASVPLVALAWARSGEKGDLFNVAVIARKPEYLGYIRKALTPAAVADWYRHFLADSSAPKIAAYEVPGIDALNFVVDESMAGGLNKSPRLDSGAKGMAQQLLEFPVPISHALAASPALYRAIIAPNV